MKREGRVKPHLHYLCLLGKATVAGSPLHRLSSLQLQVLTARQLVVSEESHSPDYYTLSASLRTEFLQLTEEHSKHQQTESDHHWGRSTKQLTL